MSYYLPYKANEEEGGTDFESGRAFASLFLLFSHVALNGIAELQPLLQLART